jgi:hypothetical protein
MVELGTDGVGNTAGVLMLCGSVSDACPKNSGAGVNGFASVPARGITVPNGSDIGAEGAVSGVGETGCPSTASIDELGSVVSTKGLVSVPGRGTIMMLPQTGQRSDLPTVSSGTAKNCPQAQAT